MIEPQVFLLCFLIKFRRFFYQLNTHGFLFSLPLGLRGFFPTNKSHDLKRPHACRSSHPRKKAIVISSSHMTSHVMDLTRSGQFHIITYSEVDLSLIIRHLTYLINILNHPFKINLSNQPFKIILHNQLSSSISRDTGLW